MRQSNKLFNKSEATYSGSEKTNKDDKDTQPAHDRLCLNIQTLTTKRHRNVFDKNKTMKAEGKNKLDLR